MNGSKLIPDALTLYLSGVAEYKNDKEIIVKDKNNLTTVEFVDDNFEKAVVRYYWSSGQLGSEDNYKNGKLDGTSKLWNLDGKLIFDGLFKNGRCANKITKGSI